MSFRRISKDAEELLHAVIKSGGIYSINITCFRDYAPQYTASLIKELQKEHLCECSQFISGHANLSITGKGKDYFVQKNINEEQRNNQSFNITAKNNSPININTGSGQAIQNISTYTVEQSNAVNEFKDAVNASSELSDEHKNEILELLASMEESKAQNKTFTFNSLANRVNEVVTTSNTLHAIWTGVTTLFS